MTDTPAVNAAVRLGSALRDGDNDSERLRGRMILTGLGTVSPYPQVLAFHHLYGLPHPEQFTPLSVTDMERRLRLHLEEFLELVDACGFRLVADNNLIAYPGIDYPENMHVVQHALAVQHVEGKLADYPKIFDALCDCTVVDYGHAIEMGVNLEDPMIETHASNMTKLGEDGKPIINQCIVEHDDDSGGASRHGCSDPSHLIRSDAPVGKVLKGPNFIEPDYMRVLTPNV